MAKKVYVGVGGVSRVSKAGYIGVNGVARSFTLDKSAICRELQQTIPSGSSSNYMFTTGLTWNFGFMPDGVICWNETDVYDSRIRDVFSSAMFLRDYPLRGYAYDYGGDELTGFRSKNVGSDLTIEWLSNGCRIYTSRRDCANNAQPDVPYHCIGFKYA